MTTMRTSSPPFDVGDLVYCRDSTGDESHGLVVEIRATPGAFRDSSCSVPAYEVDVIFGHFNSFLRIVGRAQSGSVSGLLTVSDTIIARPL